MAVQLGVDENGLGPRLGPLVVTAVTARAPGERAPARPRGALGKRLGDSKKLISHGDTALGEAWARAIARRMGARDAADPEGTVRALSLDTADALRAPCPRDHHAQCWDASGEGFVAADALVAQVERDLDRLAEKGIEVLRATCVIACARRLNEGVDRGLSRL